MPCGQKNLSSGNGCRLKNGIKLKDKDVRVLYINLSKAKAMLSNTTFKEEKVFEAHTEKRKGFREYILKSEYDKLLSEKAMQITKEKIDEDKNNL